MRNSIPDAMAIHSMIGFFYTFLHLHNIYFNKEAPIPCKDLLQYSANKAIYSFPYAVNGAFAIEIRKGCTQMFQCTKKFWRES